MEEWGGGHIVDNEDPEVQMSKQVGQLLVYLLGAELERIRKIRGEPKAKTSPILGIFMKNMMVSSPKQFI